MSEKPGILAKIGAALTGLPATPQTSLVKAAPAPEQKALILPPHPFWLEGNPAYQSYDDQPLAGPTAFALSVLCMAPMRFRATTFVEAPLWLIDETDDGEEWVTGTHPLERLLEQPNPDMDAGDFWTLVSYYLDMPGGGSCLLVKTRDRAGRVISLYPYARGEFEVKPANGRLFGRFTVTDLNGVRADYAPEDVIWLREVDPRHHWSGLAPADMAMRDLNLSEQQRNAVAATFRNAIMPGSVTMTEQMLSDEQFTRWKASMSAEYGGVVNGGKNMLIEGGGTWTQVKAALKDLDFGPLSDRLESTIASAFGVDPLLLGWHASADRNGGLSDSLGPALENYYRLHGVPRWRRIADKLTAGLLREVEPGNLRRFLRFDTSGVQALQENVGEKAAWLKDATWLTTNEKRAATGYAPIEGDPTADSLPAPIQAPAQDAEDEDERPALALVKAARRRETKQWTPEAMDAAWAAFDTKATRQEDGYERAALALFAAETADVVRRLRGAVPKAASDTLEQKADPGDFEAAISAAFAEPYVDAALARVISDYAPGGEYHEAWRARYETLIRGTVKAAVAEASETFGVRIGMAHPAIVETIAKRAMELATFVGETTAEEITKVIASARADGLSMTETVKRLRAQMDGISPARAKRIARTETVGALAEANHTTATASGVMRSKRWGSQRVGDVRPNHVRWDGDGWQPIDYLYPGAKGGMQHPGDRNGGAKETVNCRCFCMYSDQTPEEIAAEESA